MADTFAIVGAGLAGARAAETLRAEGFDGRVVLFGAEAHLPYERPALSKGYLQGTAEAPFVHPAEWYAEQDVDLRLGTRVTALDPSAHEVETADGDRLRYTKLLLTTGSSVRRLADAVTLRTLDDSDRLRAALRSGTRVVIVGAGWIGLEVAAAARVAGAEVTVLEQAPAPLLAALGLEMAAVFARLHVEHGVDLRCGVTVRAVRSDAVLLDDETVPADLVVAGIGVTPDVDLARAAGLAVDNGIVVDEHLRSSAPDVWAAGDVANAYHPFAGRHVRVEHWANALHQPVVAAQAMLGKDAVYDRLPYFFTDQYDLGMEYTGFGGGEVVVRGDEREFVAFWLRDGRLTAAMNVNVWTGVPEIAGRLIRSGTRLDAAALADPAVPLEDVAA
jgi:3-phenylpropionate/trans-cinnamate dioxygenase ferredoxin reductase component